ncbi:MAG TPA: hypothetical protein VGK74_01175 [Symbiobacteriaceae bacterium]|jgi:hypothetical protein
MGAAWEWRGFQPHRDGDALLELAGAIAATVGLERPRDVVAERDAYLVLPGLRHNFKLRRGALEVKRQVVRLREGFSLWQDKVVWDFPLAPERLAELWSLLPGRGSLPPSEASSSAALVAALRKRGLTLVQVTKHRVRMDDGRARLELADLELSESFRWISVCVDGYDLEGVRDLVRRSRVRPGTRVMSYIDLLHEALWWCPELAEEAVTTGDICSP